MDRKLKVMIFVSVLLAGIAFFLVKSEEQSTRDIAVVDNVNAEASMPVSGSEFGLVGEDELFGADDESTTALIDSDTDSLEAKRKLIEEELLQKSKALEIKSAKSTTESIQPQKKVEVKEKTVAPLKDGSTGSSGRDVVNLQVKAFKEQIASLKKTEKELRQKLLLSEKNVDELSKKLSEGASEQVDIGKLVKEKAELGNLVSVKDKKITQLEKTLLSAEEKQQTLASSLRKENIELKSRVRLLSEEIASIGRKPQSNKKLAARTSSVPTGKSSVKREAAPQSRSSKIMTVKVLVPKANLRTGPGSEHGVLQQMPKGVELLTETKVGDWYRVISPTGKRAFISAKVVRAVGNDSSLLQPRQTKKSPSTNPSPKKGNKASRLAEAFKKAAKESQPNTASPAKGSKSPQGFVPFGEDVEGENLEKKVFERIKKKLSK